MKPAGKLVAVVFVLRLALEVHAQREERLVGPVTAPEREQQRRFPVKGEVYLEGIANLPSGLAVELCEIYGSFPLQRAHVMSTGEFELRDVEEGSYRIRVVNARYETIQEQLVSIRPGSGPLRIGLAQERTPRPPSGTVPLARLSQPVPSKALKEFSRSREALRAGDVNRSVEHLEKAIRIYPAFLEAHNNLGAHYMAKGEVERAAEEFRKTAELEPASVLAHSNLGAALFSLGRYEEAEASVRRALELDPRFPKARYVLGCILAVQGKSPEEALDLLRGSASRFPLAHWNAAALLVRQGQNKEAAAALRLYLKSGHPEKRAEAEVWLARLEP